LHNGSINTDAIDNSGGVDMSDHEVNLKILLNPMVQKGTLSLEDRNSMLEEMTEEVAQMVLHNNDTHGRQLSLDLLRSKKDPMKFSSIIQWVCSKGNVSRNALRLPTDEELLRRHTLNEGLTRPELAVLAAHVKMHVFKSVKELDISIIPGFSEHVASYFPRKIQNRYPEDLQKHMLHTSIGSTVLLNDIVGWAGAWLFPGLNEITGASATEIIRAWMVAMSTIEEKSLLKDVLKNCPTPDSSYYAWTSITAPVYSLLTSWLFSGKLPNAEQQIKIREVLELLPSIGGKDCKHRQKQLIGDLKTHDIPTQLAKRIASLSEICAAHEIVQRMEEGQSIADAITSYYALGEASSFLPIIRLLENRRSSGGWDPAAKAILQSRFLHLQSQLVECIDLSPELPIGVDRLIHRLKTGRLERLSNELDSIIGESGDLSSLIVANARAMSRFKREFLGPNKYVGTQSRYIEPQSK